MCLALTENYHLQARRRILAPAHRSSTGPTTTAPFPPPGRGGSLSSLLDPMSRRASMPGGNDTLQLYHPMTLQSVPHSSYSATSTRHIVSNMPPRSHTLGGDYAPSSRHSMYPPVQNGGPGHPPPGHYMSSDVGPLSAPPSISNNPFSSHNSHHSSSGGGQGVYPLLPSPRSTPGHHASYLNDAPSHSNSTGSAYGTPP